MILNRILRVNRSNLKVSRNFIKSSSTHQSGITLKGYTKGLLFGATAGSIIYDGFNDFEVAGGLSRFLRSLKIATTISLDYSWSLYGLENGTELYDQVRLIHFNGFVFFFISIFNNTYKLCVLVFIYFFLSCTDYKGNKFT